MLFCIKFFNKIQNNSSEKSIVHLNALEVSRLKWFLKPNSASKVIEKSSLQCNKNKKIYDFLYELPRQLQPVN